MRVHTFLLAGLLYLVQVAAMSEEPGDLVTTFTTLENTFARGYQEKNISVLEGLLAPEYALTVSARPSDPIPRSEWLALIPKYNVRHFEIRGVQVRCLQIARAGPCELAAVSSINKQDADVGGQDRSGEFFIVDIWAHRSGKWMVLSRYSGRTEAVVPKLMEKKK